MKHIKTIKSSVLILGVIIIPLLYSFFYLGAFWDPYNTLKTLPVAVVNDDKGATINDASRNLGKEATDALLDDGTLKFVVTDDADAKEGAEGTKYYAVITFPSNFSESIASASTTNKQVAQIKYVANQKRNFIASQIMKNVVTKIEETTRGDVNKEITSTLTSKLKKVPSQLSTLNDGLKTLNEGAATLCVGTSKASDGQNTLSSGIKTLNTGINKLSSGGGSLNSGLSTLSSGLNQASDGAQQLSTVVSKSLPALKSGVTQLNTGAQTLLKQFSASTDAKKPTVYDGVTGVAKGTQSLLSQFSTSSNAKNPTIYDGVTSVASGTPTYVSAVDNTLYTMITSDPASTQLLAGYKSSLAKVQAAYAASTDATAKAQYVQKMQMLANLVTIYSAATDSSVTSEAAFETALVSMAQSDTTKQSVVSSGATLAAGTKQLASQFADGGTLKTSVASLAGASQQVASQFEDGGAFKTGVSNLAAGTATLADSTSSLGKLSTGINKLSTALSALNGGSAKLYTGAQQLSSGLTSAQSGSETLLTGSNKLATAGTQINDGAHKIATGISSAKSGVSDSMTKANDQIKSLSGLDTYAKEPVVVKQDNLNPIPNYGTGFAPYFMSLSLYVGALIMFFGIYLDADERIKVLSRHSKNKFVRVGAFSLIGIAQAVALAMICQFSLGLKVANVPIFYLSCILISLVFISIVEFFIVNLKDVGKFLALALLVLQLTSCAGTFPMETIPKFFNVIYPYMPMTYSVKLLKESISNFNGASAWNNALVLIGIFAVFTALTVLFSLSRKAKVRIQERLQAEESV